MLGHSGHPLHDRGDADETSVGGIGRPVDVARLLQAIDHPCGRPGRQPRQLGEAARRGCPGLCQEHQALHVRRRETGSFGDALRERRGRISQAAGLTCQVVHEARPLGRRRPCCGSIGTS